MTESRLNASVTWVAGSRRCERSTFNELRIPRQFIPTKETPTAYRLHVFGDASPLAFSAVAYLDSRYADAPPAFSLIMCRSRVAPLEGTTLPRLELLAALIAVGLKRFLSDRMSVKFERVHLYTDSMITYHWVTSANSGSYKTFVYNRTREIQNSSTPEEWSHLPGDSNISDLATRGLSAEDLVENHAWWNGPSWLGLPDDQKPTAQPQSVAADALLQQVRAELRKTVAPIASRPSIIDINNFRGIGHAVRVIAYAVRFTALKDRRPPDISSGELYRRAELILIRSTQAEPFRRNLVSPVRASARPLTFS